MKAPHQMRKRKKPVELISHGLFTVADFILNLQLRHSYIPGVGVVGAGSVGAGSEGVGSLGAGSVGSVGTVGVGSVGSVGSAGASVPTGSSTTSPASFKFTTFVS